MPDGMTDLTDLTIGEAAALLAEGEITSLELTGGVLSRLAETEPCVRAYTVVCETALAEAQRADRRRRDGALASSPLLGIPVAVKDLFHMSDASTEAGSRVLKGFRPDKDASTVARLREAGAVLVGKTVMHEFAYGMNVPPTRNPWRLDSYPGGSSAGSAVAVAVGSAFAALGTDTAGSVRTPASVNGVVGLKPTYGRISRFGVIPASPSLDHVGIISRSVGDSALLLGVLAGHDPLDPTSLLEPSQDWIAESRREGLAGVRLGIDRAYFLDWPGVAGGVRQAVVEALQVLKGLGACIVEVSIPALEWSSVVGSTIMTVDYSTWHQQLLRTHFDDYEPGTRRMLMLGLMVPAVTYAQAQRVRRVVVQGVREAFASARLDALVAPTIPVTAPTIAAMTDADGAIDLSGLVHHSLPANVTGLPALTVPCGLDGGMPVGLQIIGRPLDEGTILGIGSAFERATPWSRRREVALSHIGRPRG